MVWSHGYYAQSGYSYGIYAETMPARLRWVSLLQGQRLPATYFRYLDAGCGQGLNLITAAVLHPESEFVGIDFLPQHVAHARDVAQRCGLNNITFIEGDFVELAKDPSALGEFDYAICHGIATWVGPEVKQALFKLIGQTLRAGGVFYNSYNTLPGWLAGLPFQHLVTLEQRTKSGPEALTAARLSLEKLAGVAEVLFKQQPGLSVRLKSLDSQDPAYLLQEYNHDHWRPVFVSEMMDDMAQVKLSYLGTATLADVFESVVKPELREMLQAQSNVVMREQLRDYAVAQSFRRDLYIKGKRLMWPQEYGDEVRSTRMMVNPLLPRPTGDDPYRIKGSTQDLLGKPEFYNGILARLQGAQGATVGELVDGEHDPKNDDSVIEAISMMVQGGWIVPRLDLPNPRGPQVTAVLAKMVCQGAPYRALPLPLAGSGHLLPETDWILVKLISEGVPHDQLATRLVPALSKLGRKLGKDGKAIDNDRDRDALINRLVAEFISQTLPLLKMMGAV